MAETQPITASLGLFPGQRYTLAEDAASGVVVLDHPHYGRQLFTAAIIRAERKRCAMCDEVLQKGDRSFRPQTNLENRWHRICLRCLDRLRAKP